jgi:transcription termination/antitermination protein NusG
MRANLSADKAWYVVRTNIRCEAKADENLRKAGFESYLPMVRFERWNKRTRIIRTFERPLMLRYLFLALPRHAQHFGFARSCEGVERILGDVDNHPIQVPFALVNGLFIAEANLEFDDTREARIHRKEEARTKKETIAMRFFAGSEWLITDGPFASFRAEVENVTSAGLVRVLVNIFGRMTPVELEPGQLDHPVKKRRAA